jgi:hypothetical protein
LEDSMHYIRITVAGPVEPGRCLLCGKIAGTLKVTMEGTRGRRIPWPGETEWYEECVGALPRGESIN